MGKLDGYNTMKNGVDDVVSDYRMHDLANYQPSYPITLLLSLHVDSIVSLSCHYEG